MLVFSITCSIIHFRDLDNYSSVAIFKTTPREKLMTKKKILGLAVAAALSVGVVAQSAQAANIAPSGVGEIVYVPYFSTKDGKESYVRLVNNGFDTLIVKFKVREGTESVDARDFHVFLSPRDVWTAKISTDANGGVRLSTFDTSCTVPDKVRGWQDDGNGGWSINIPAVGNTGSSEGYIVAQVMGTSESTVFSPFDNDDDVASLAKHITKTDANGNSFVSPRDYFALSTPFELNTTDLSLKNPDILNGLRAQFTEPTNALSAAAAIVNPVNATLTDLPVTALANVFNPGPTGVDGTSDYNDPIGHSDFPNDNIQSVAGAFPDVDGAQDVATIFDDDAATLTALAATGIPVSAALMHSSVMNNLDTTGSNSWVITFPTKKNHLSSPCSAPFPADCTPDITSIQHTVHDKGEVSYVTNEEESEFTTPDTNQICFSGPDLAQQCPLDSNPNSISLPTEVNVISMGDNGNPLRSDLETNISSAFLGNIVYGWMQMRFTDAVSITGTEVNSGASTSLYGLPVIGFAYTEYNIGGITTMSQAHTYTSPLTK